jgi:hypothetical protein
MNLNDINARILNEICNDTLLSLSDTMCLDKYKQCDSLKNKIESLDIILSNNNISEEQRKNIISNYILQLISPGLKGVIRGNKFNDIIKDNILSMNLDPTKYEIAFERKSNHYETSEIPDWYILQKETSKIMIGMNQLDLWTGGQQLNRASKYVLNFSDNSDKIRLLCVVANPIKLTSDKNKVFKIFQKGFQDNTLCYLKNLHKIIHIFFKV